MIAGIDKETGSIEEGKSADMIVVRNDPLEDLSVLRNVSMVMIKGRLIEEPKVRKMKDVDDLLDRYM